MDITLRLYQSQGMYTSSGLVPPMASLWLAWCWFHLLLVPCTRECATHGFPVTLLDITAWSFPIAGEPGVASGCVQWRLHRGRYLEWAWYDLGSWGPTLNTLILFYMTLYDFLKQGATLIHHTAWRPIPSRISSPSAAGHYLGFSDISVVIHCVYNILSYLICVHTRCVYHILG